MTGSGGAYTIPLRESLDSAIETRRKRRTNAAATDRPDKNSEERLTASATDGDRLRGRGQRLMNDTILSFNSCEMGAAALSTH